MGNKPRIRFKGFTEDWEQCKLGEFVNIVSGDAPSTFISGNCIYVKVDDLNYSDRIQLSSSNLVNANPKAHLVNTGATIFPKRGAAIMTNKVRIMGQDGYLDTNMMALIPKEIDKDFLFTFIQKTGLYKIADTSTIPQINNKHIEPYMIQVPTNKEQECIGVFFEKIDKIITLHQCKLEKLKLTKKALLQKLFPKNGKHIPEIRFKGFTDAWEQRKLSELATMNARIGWQNLRTSEFLDSGDYLLITGTDFDNGRIKYGTCHYVEKKRFDQDTKIQLSTGSILITKDGTLGKVALVEELPKPATLNAGVFNVRVKDDAVLSYKYLYHYLKAPFLMKYVTANATGGTIKHLNQSILVDFPIPITEKLEQDRIAKLLDSLELSITLHQRKLERLQELKKGLLQKMFV